MLPGVSRVLETRTRADAQPVYCMNGAVAGSCARTSSVAGRHSAVKSQPRKLKGPGAFKLPARAISTKNKHLLVIYSIPTRGFTAAVSVFRGTPPTKPLICKLKIRLVRASDAIFRSWADPTGEDSLLILAKFNLPPEDIIKMSLYTRSQILYLSSLLISTQTIHGKQKPCLHAVSRVEEILFRFVTCLHRVYPNYLRAVSR